MTFSSALVIGGSKGIGKAFVEYFQSSGINVGCLNSKEYAEIKNEKSLQSHLNDTDICVLNAHLGFQTVEIFLNIVKFWRGKKKNIVVIGSITSDMRKDKINVYNLEKKAIEESVLQVQLETSRPSVTLVKPGWVDTDLVKHIKSKNKMPPKSLVETTMSTLLTCEHRDLVLKSISLDNRLSED